MSNGQPSGAQTSTTTENGAYNLNGATSGNAVAANTVNPNTLLAPTFRIPLENEWYKAAYYSPNYGGAGVGGYWTWATQSNSAPGTTIGSSPNQASYDVYDAATDVGSFSGSGSFYGTFDQSGNVWEWNDLNGIAGSNRGIRGGMWEYNSADVSSSSRMPYEPDNEDYDVGFRLAGPAPSVGDTGPGGGIIFYDAGSIQSWGRYLEVACVSWQNNCVGTTADPQALWGCYGTQISGAAGTAIGTGKQNTTDIVNGCVTSDITAAELAAGYSHNTLDDWFLPSKDELNALCKWAFGDTTYAVCNNGGSGGLSLTGVGGFSTEEYWSSSGNAAFAAWTQDFDYGYQFNLFKNDSYYVRPVRAF
jgi:hypothetical protein